MRFLMVATFYPPYSFGGDAAYVYRLSHELARRGHEVEVIHCADAYRLQRSHPRSSSPSDSRVRVHTLNDGAGPLSPLLTQQTGRMALKSGAIRRLIERGGFDVIHYHNMSLIGLDALTVGDAAKLYTTHEHWLVCPMHVLWRNSREACTTQTCVSCQLISGRPPQWWRSTSLMNRCTEHVDRFLCPSRFTLEKHRELGFHGSMVHLPYFLPRVDRPADATPPHPRPYALFVGRLEALKGVHNLIEAFRHYRGCDLVIVGDGTCETDLRTMADGLSHMTFLGRLSFEQVRHWSRHALAIVVPSICYEVFGIVVLEGFSVSTPALVTPFGALPEVIEESGGGFVYRSDDELVGMLDRLRQQPAVRAQLGERGYQAYMRLWSADPHIDGYLRILRDVTEEASRPSA